MSTPPKRPIIPIQPASTALYAAEAKIYARSVSGYFANWRWVMVWFTQLVFYGGAWLQWNGRQALLFDLGERRFYVLGLVLHPQDFIYLAALLVISALGLFFFTAVAGRLWCGYTCPQTVYTEMFMWIERHIEGDRLARMRLDESPWNTRKLLRKGGKHAAWLALALVTGFSFVGYFVPVRELAQSVASLDVSAWEGFWVLFYALATYGNAGFMREQVCKYMCPYARFQSALIDRDSMVIAYDSGRGEPRGSRSKKADLATLGLGSCVDCTMCVQVCPTGIDIRNGLQNECIGCAACIDVCDDVMDKMGYARGLIRYATENGVAGQWNRAQMLRRLWRPRVLIYGTLLLAASGTFVASLAGRDAFQIDVIKDRGVLARVVDDGMIENVYRLQLMNNREQPQRLRLRVDGPAGLRLAGGGTELTLPATGLGQQVVSVHLPPEAAQALRGSAVPIRFVIEGRPLAEPGAAPEVVREASTFYVPR
ncbi:cytochrome c oxidase accessory protein CcoG [Leptothrix cholodnii SP-6]|uniref:Cytochrome c oxidase accessory protein CcoG n=1 Tax=Leptothrix cholodnii (strain ATCC 51168 / LMG 8142 / SP-6) TaxID=395495 RepID=B1Y803_LEPCP|nr:cytochrome c oxidase accessory protein CcoG [Leptothrix cholodnii]ACB33745.1 cytochrome c oxidase accessory protein CcoG [Leptothrix cholodnii SP-6]